MNNNNKDKLNLIKIKVIFASKNIIKKVRQPTKQDKIFTIKYLIRNLNTEYILDNSFYQC